MNNSQVKDLEQQQPGIVQSMLDASINGILLLEPVHDFDSVITDFTVKAVNKAITDHAGIELKDATNRRMTELFPSYKTDGFFDVYMTAFLTGKQQRKEMLYKDERLEGWYEIAVAPHQEGIVVTFANITEQRNYRQQIETSASQLDAIINTSQSGIFLFSPVFSECGELEDFRFTKANPALASYVGQKQDALIGELGSKWFPAYKDNGLFKLYSETYLTGKTNRFDFNYNADNIDVWLDILSSKLGDQVLVTFTDYTPTKRLQLELEETVDELKRSNSNLEEFAYVASHDLQEPLRKIQYFSERLMQLYSGQVDAAGLIGRMEDATNRMRILIEDLLTYSRFSVKNNTDETVDLNRLVQEVLSDLEATITEKKAVIDLQTLPAITGDKLQLRQLFQNLVSNALKYNRANVPLKITISSTIINGDQAAETLPFHDQHKKFYEVKVADNGLGFDQQYSKHIFKIFQRLFGRSEYPGTGVGLAIVQKVTENHKGYVFAEGVPGEGAVFKVMIPV